jgi:hypothetical protein
MIVSTCLLGSVLQETKHHRSFLLPAWLLRQSEVSENLHNTPQSPLQSGSARGKVKIQKSL